MFPFVITTNRRFYSFSITLRNFIFFDCRSLCNGAENGQLTAQFFGRFLLWDKQNRVVFPIARKMLTMKYSFFQRKRLTNWARISGEKAMMRKCCNNIDFVCVFFNTGIDIQTQDKFLFPQKINPIQQVKKIKNI